MATAMSNAMAMANAMAISNAMADVKCDGNVTRYGNMADNNQRSGDHRWLTEAGFRWKQIKGFALGVKHSSLPDDQDGSWEKQIRCG